MLKELVNKINDSGLSPNQYFTLYCLLNKLRLKTVDIKAELAGLEGTGHIQGGEITSKLFDEEEEEKGLHMRTVDFLQIFPPIYIPGTTIHARGKLHPVKLKLKAFIKTYNYDWDIIYEATDRFIRRHAENGYDYMQCASTFIFDKNGDSTLALECDTLEYNSKKEVAL